jgi:hypothetical protein
VEYGKVGSFVFMGKFLMSTVTDFKTLIAEDGIGRPYLIRIKSGKTYKITEGSEIFIPHSYPNLLIIAIPGKGISLVGLSSIEAIEGEHEDLPE